MKQVQPHGFNRRRVQQLLSKARYERLAGRRIEVLSRQFLGSSYKPNPLIGSAHTPEVFTVSLEGFDCVTYIETVLALARADSVDDFIKYLRKIRYEQGRVQWDRRNHYMTGWIGNNLRDGIIGPISISAVPLVSRQRVLNVVPGLAAQPTCVRCVPKHATRRLEPLLEDGDLIFFASTRKNLDVFHTGIIVRNDGKLILRHASRSRGLVVDQELSEFLKANRMAGVIVARPQG